MVEFGGFLLVARVCLSSAALAASCAGLASPVPLLGGSLEASSSALLVLVGVLGLVCRHFSLMSSWCDFLNTMYGSVCGFIL